MTVSSRFSVESSSAVVKPPSSSVASRVDSFVGSGSTVRSLLVGFTPVVFDSEVSACEGVTDASQLSSWMQQCPVWGFPG